MSKRIGIGTLLLLACWLVGAETGEGEPDPAVAQAIERAEAGDVETQRVLGSAYLHGGRVERDLARSAHWYRMAAEQGDAEAQRILGLMYRDGVGVAADPDAAFRWLHRAAQQGDVEAEGALGSMFEEGMGVEADPAQAFAWYLRAAEAGHSGAQFNVGAMYMNGVGVPVDHVQAVMWLTLAAERERSARYLIYTKEEEIAPEDLAEGRRLAAARASGDAEAEGDPGGRTAGPKLIPR